MLSSVPAIRVLPFAAAAFLIANAARPVEIAAPEDCRPAIEAGAEAAREAAAAWARGGGGAAARICEAAALEALGATASAALLLTRVAENPNRAMSATLRATVFGDAARLWLEAGRPELARAALGSAARIAPPDRHRLMLDARSAAAEEDWPAAEAALDAVIAAAPEDALALALRAAARRHSGAMEAALADAEAALARAPGLPEALFERGAVLAETGRTAEAADPWLDLIARAPEHPLAAAARRNLQTSGADGSP